MTIFQSSDHCLFVNDFSSRCVDDNCSWFQSPNPFLADETNGFWAQRYMYAQYVGLGQHIFNLLKILTEGWRGRVSASRVVNDTHWECMRQDSQTSPNSS